MLTVCQEGMVVFAGIGFCFGMVFAVGIMAWKETRAEPLTWTQTKDTE